MMVLWEGGRGRKSSSFSTGAFTPPLAKKRGGFVLTEMAIRQIFI